MDEADMKVAALNWVRRTTRGALPVIASEFSLNGTNCRADLAVLGREFTGIEIKSTGDTLKRLPAQLVGYNRYFDRTLVLIAPKHEHGVRKIELLGATVAVQTDARTRTIIVEGDDAKVSGHTLLGLLTAEDERRAMRSISDDLGNVDIDQARQAFEAVFRKRYKPTSDAFWAAVRGRQITAADLRLLSRFHVERQQARDMEAARKNRWAVWVEALTNQAVPA